MIAYCLNTKFSHVIVKHVIAILGGDERSVEN